MNTSLKPSSSTRREIVAYLGLVNGLALIVVLALPHSEINMALSTLLPALAVGILTFTLIPKGSRRELWRVIGLGRAGLKVWAAAIALPFALVAGAYGAALLIGAGWLPNWHPADVSAFDAFDWTTNLIINVVIVTMFVVCEEIGWRGFLLPRFQLMTSKKKAAIATGFSHGCFHLPLILFATTYDTGGSRWITAPMVVAVITAGGVFYAWIWDRAGTVWPVAIAHGVVNTVFGLGAASVVATAGWNMAYVAGETGFATLGVCLVSAVVLLRRARVWQTPVSRGSVTVNKPGHELVPASAA